MRVFGWTKWTTPNNDVQVYERAENGALVPVLPVLPGVAQSEVKVIQPGRRTRATLSVLDARRALLKLSG